MPAVRGHCDKVVYPGACIERSCPFVYAYEAWGTPTSAACSACTGSRSTSTCCGRPRRGGRASAGSAPRARRCRCARSRSRACYESRGDELGCRNPEFHECPRERAELPGDRADHRPRNVAGPSAGARGFRQRRCRSRSFCTSAASGPWPSGPGLHHGGQPWTAGWARNAPSRSPSSPSSTFACRSRFEPSGAAASLTCSARRRSSPIRASSSFTRRGDRLRLADVDARDVEVAGVEADAEPRMRVERVDDRRQLVDRATDRAARAGRVLEQEPRRLRAAVEHLAQGRHGPLEPRLEAAAEVEPTWKTTPSASIAQAASTVARIVSRLFP